MFREIRLVGTMQRAICARFTAGFVWLCCDCDSGAIARWPFLVLLVTSAAMVPTSGLKQQTESNSLVLGSVVAGSWGISSAMFLEAIDDKQGYHDPIIVPSLARVLPEARKLSQV